MTAVQAPPPRRVEDSAAQPLALVTRLIQQLAQEEIRYCHWKSNEHLGPALAGRTDLDVLVDHQAAAAVTRILGELGFKQFSAPPEAAYIGVEDYLGFDEETGRLAHLHLHYRLVLGEKFLKGYRLPWEDLLLGARRIEPVSGIYVCEPNLELLLLLVRAAIKLRRRDQLTTGSRQRYVTGDFQREFEWLVERMNPERFQSLAQDLLGVEAAQVVVHLVPKVPSTRQLLELRRAIGPVLDRFRTFSRRGADLQRWRREWRSRSGRALRRFLGIRVPIGFTLPRGGVVVAFIGADGSGKSTVVQAVNSWLGWRLEVLPLYLGFGDGKASWHRTSLQLLARAWIRSNPTRKDSASAAATTTHSRSPAGPLERAKAIWRVLWAWSIVREKRARLQQAVRARNLGQAVICDRYPQSQVGELSDGPLLSRWNAGSGVFAAAARWEEAAYRTMETITPDLVIKLHVSPEVSARRKLDVSLESLRERVDTVRRLRFARPTKVVEIDSNQPLEQVLLHVKRAVWEAL